MKGRLLGLFSLVAACSSRGGTLDFNFEGGVRSDVGGAVDVVTAPDAGSPTDAGTPPEDSGVPPEDAGSPPADIGPVGACTMDSECRAAGLVCDRVMSRCVECIADADCGRGRFCPPAHVCTVQVCTPGESTCVSSARQSTCNSRGSAQTETACASGETCRSGRCQPTACSPGTATCDEATGQRRVCSSDGSGTTLVACPSGQRCSGGACVAQACVPDSRTCASISTIRVCDSAGTSSTTMACPDFPNARGGCAINTCGFVCNDGFGDCNRTFSDGCEADLGSTAAHCGACGRACAGGEVCVGGSCTNLTGAGFRVTSLGSTSCVVAGHKGVSGDDRGGIAVSTDAVFYSGDVSTIRLPFGSVSPTQVGTVHNSIFSDLATGTLYVLMNSSSVELPDLSVTTTQLASRIGRLSSTGVLTTDRILPTLPIRLHSTQSDGMMFSGRNLVVIYGGSSDGITPGTWWAVSLPTGSTRELGSFTPPTHIQCENWAAWGVVESVAGELSLLYIESATSIARFSLTSRTVTNRFTFTNLGDACGFSVSPVTNHWYFHSENATQFSPSSSEVLVSCPASMTTTP